MHDIFIFKTIYHHFQHGLIFSLYTKDNNYYIIDLILSHPLKSYKYQKLVIVLIT
jgi:hypothetical protein